ncbi:MAG: hypothetical protein AAGE94_08255 [Acidobacteriota bacterium]
MQRAKSPLVLFFVLVVFGFTTTAAFAGPPPFTTTELIAGNNAPAVNGANLLAAVAAAAPNTLIKLEPGVYDLRGDQIVLPDFVDIEGSGRDITTVFSDLSVAATPAVVDVQPGIHGEVRELTIQAGQKSTTIGVDILSDEFLLTEVNIEVKSVENAIGIRIRESAPRINECFVRILSAENEATGILIDQSGAVITQSLVFASNVAGTLRGIDMEQSTATLDGAIVFVFFAEDQAAVRVAGTASRPEIVNTRATSQGNGRSIGLLVEDFGDPQVKESTFRAQGDQFAIALSMRDAQVRATESTFEADPIAFPHLNVFAARLTGFSNLEANQSNVISTSFAVQNFGAGLASFGASQLTGAAVPAAAASLRCVFTYFGNYTPRNAVCN